MKIIENFIWLEVSLSTANSLFNAGSIDIYTLHVDGSESLLESEDEISKAYNTGESLVIEVGKLPISAIADKKFNELTKLGLIDAATMNHNVGDSNYAAHTIQPWHIWLDYPELTPWDCDIIKRILRTKVGNEILDYEKIKHICDERIRQLTERDGVSYE